LSTPLPRIRNLAEKSFSPFHWHRVNPRAIRERCRLASLTSLDFLSQECAIDRAAIARSLSSPYSELGHFDARYMRLTY
jgi:hypothetical protein